jgi:CheY-like chemotaxis protein
MDVADREVRLLLVDDSQFFRNMLAPLLTASGYEVTLAASAEEALALKDKGVHFDLIVSDIDMPGMDGLALAERIKADPKRGQGPADRALVPFEPTACREEPCGGL